MRNPALVILYAIPILVIAFGGFLAAKAAIDFDSYDPKQHRINMAKIIGNAEGLPSEAELRRDKEAAYNAQLLTASLVAGSGAAGILLPLSITAVGRSTKNAAREAVETIISTRQ